MNRRRFLQTSGAAAFALSNLPNYPAEFADPKKRVGLIGSGWYGKVDLLRLIQVAPVEVVSLCDVDKRMLNEAADIIASRQLSKKKPRTYSDYREMLKEKDLDLVLIATPDHWHALTAIEAIKAGADLYLQNQSASMWSRVKPFSRRPENINGSSGTQRRSTPHLIEARDRVIKEGKLGRIAHVEICCYYHMRPENPPDATPPEHLDYEMWTGPAPMRRNNLVHPRRWRALWNTATALSGTCASICWIWSGG
jgi:hypothetical protein